MEPNDILSLNDIEHSDFLDLLRPTELLSSIIQALFQLGLASTHSISFVPSEVTAEFSTGEHRIYQRLTDANNSLTPLRRSIFSQTVTVYLFAAGSHYTIVITDCALKQISFADSIMTNPSSDPWEVSMVKQFVADEANDNKYRQTYRTGLQYFLPGQ